MVTETVRVGFTGTRYGLSDEQKQTLPTLLTDVAEFHHGDCVGADADGHAIAFGLGIPIHVHPPSDDRLRAYSVNFIQTYQTKGYFGRDRDIVDFTDYLIACPRSRSSRTGGTWFTIGYARSKHKSVDVIWPDGEVTTL